MKDKFLITDTFIESISCFDKNTKVSLWKCLRLLSSNCFHPSLNTEKLNGTYSSRINIDYRIIHEPLVKLYRLLYAGKHDDAYRFANNYGRESDAVRANLRSAIGEKLILYYNVNLLKARKEKKVIHRGVLKGFITRIMDRFRKAENHDELVPDKIYNVRRLKRYVKNKGA